MRGAGCGVRRGYGLPRISQISRIFRRYYPGNHKHHLNQRSIEAGDEGEQVTYSVVDLPVDSQETDFFLAPPAAGGAGVNIQFFTELGIFHQEEFQVFPVGNEGF